MKNGLKNERGITLMALVITVIVLLILASIGIYNGLGTVRSSKYMAFKTELELLQSSVNEIYSENQDKLDSYGVDMTTDQKEIFNIVEVSNILNSLGSDVETLKSGFKYFSKDYLVSDLGIEGITSDYYINLSKRLIIVTEPFEYEGITYYMLEQMEDGVYNVTYNRDIGDVEFTVTSTVNEDNTANINITDIHTSNDQYINKWQIRYRKQGVSIWNTTEEFVGNILNHCFKAVLPYIREGREVHGLSSDLLYIEDSAGVSFPGIFPGICRVICGNCSRMTLSRQDISCLSVTAGNQFHSYGPVCPVRLLRRSRSL